MRKEDIQRELEQIEREGKPLTKFWKLVSEVKKNPELVDRFATQMGRIDAQAYEKKAWVRIGVNAGNALEAGGALIGFGLLIIGIKHQNEFFRGVAIVMAAFILSATLHPLAHYVAGRLAGIKFLFYFPNGPIKIEPSLKIDYATYLKAPSKHRAMMHLAGPIATIISTFACLIAGLTADLPAWAIYTLGFYFLLVFLTDLLLSPKAGDVKRFLREWRM
jgi:hypothetical protein